MIFFMFILFEFYWVSWIISLYFFFLINWGNFLAVIPSNIFSVSYSFPSRQYSYAYVTDIIHVNFFFFFECVFSSILREHLELPLF